MQPTSLPCVTGCMIVVFSRIIRTHITIRIIFLYQKWVWLSAITIRTFSKSGIWTTIRKITRWKRNLTLRKTGWKALRKILNGSCRSWRRNVSVRLQVLRGENVIFFVFPAKRKSGGLDQSKFIDLTKNKFVKLASDKNVKRQKWFVIKMLPRIFYRTFYIWKSIIYFFCVNKSCFNVSVFVLLFYRYRIFFFEKYLAMTSFLVYQLCRFAGKKSVSAEPWPRWFENE